MQDEKVVFRPIFVGLDASLTATGVFILDEDGSELYSGVFGYGFDFDGKANSKDKIERILSIIESIFKAIDTAVDKLDGCDVKVFVGIEGYAWRAKGRQFDLAELQGVIKFQLFIGRGIVAESVPISSARKTSLGKGRFSKGPKGKAEIVSAVNKKGFSVSDHNIADAYVVAECIRLRRRTIKQERLSLW